MIGGYTLDSVSGLEILSYAQQRQSLIEYSYLRQCLVAAHEEPAVLGEIMRKANASLALQ